MAKKSFNDTLQELNGFLEGKYKLTEGLGIIRWNNKYWEIKSEDYLKEDIGIWLKDDYRLSTMKELFESYIVFNKTKKMNLDKIDTNKRRLVFNNGTYDLNNYIFNENMFYKEDYCTRIFDFDYSENSSFDVFKKYLSNVMCDDEDLIKIIQEMIGYCLIDSCEYQKAFILYGEGGTGKSTLIDTLSNIWGDFNCGQVSLDELDKADLRAGLYGKRINFANELEKNIDDSSYFKTMIVGESVNARFLYKDSFNFRNTAKMIFATNNLPTIKDKTDGTLRRFIIIPFEKSFLNEEDREVKLLDKILKEKSGIIRFAIEGLKRLEASNKFTTSQKCEKYKASYKEKNDIVFNFIDECCEIHTDDTTYITVNELYFTYSSWGISNGFVPLGRTNFLREIHRLVKNSEKTRKTINKKQQYVIPNISLL